MEKEERGGGGRRGKREGGGGVGCDKHREKNELKKLTRQMKNRKIEGNGMEKGEGTLEWEKS